MRLAVLHVVIQVHITYIISKFVDHQSVYLLQIYYFTVEIHPPNLHIYCFYRLK